MYVYIYILYICGSQHGLGACTSLAANQNTLRMFRIQGRGYPPFPIPRSQLMLFVPGKFPGPHTILTVPCEYSTFDIMGISGKQRKLAICSMLLLRCTSSPC